MPALKYLTFIGKAAALAASLHPFPGVDPQTAIIIFFAASLTKDVANRVGDFIDDGKANKSFPKD